MASRSLCLPPARMHFWTEAALGGTNGGCSSPRKYGTNCIIPELVNIGADGWCGMSPADATKVCCFCSKKDRQTRRSSWASIVGTSLPAGGALAGWQAAGLDGPVELVRQLDLPLAGRHTALGHRRPHVGAHALGGTGHLSAEAFRGEP